MSNIESLPSPFTLQSAATGTGVGSALAVRGYGMAVLQVTGTFSATITPQVTLDGANFTGVETTNIATGAVALTITAAGIYVVPVAGLEALIANITGFVSGTVTVIGRGFPLTQPAYK